MIDTLVSRGHSYQDVVDRYPFELVMLLYKGINENHRFELVEDCQAMTIAICHSLDLAFGKGKGKILDSWTDGMLQNLRPEQKKKVKLGQGFMGMLHGMPSATKKKKEK